MIYVGLINFTQEPYNVKKLKTTLGSFTDTSPITLQKGYLTLIYGKLSSTQDYDQIWENDTSIMIGRVFDKEHQSSIRSIDFKASSHLSKDQFLDKVWGKYVYFRLDEGAPEIDVVLDSTGQLPFFYHRLPGGQILFASQLEIIHRVLPQKPDYNWPYLYSYLTYGDSSAIETPFKNVYELPPACHLKITRDEQKTVPYWRPLRSYEHGRGGQQDAVSVLKSVLKPWIEPYQKICVSLSGGLDSSSLVYCLSELVRDDQTLTALNYFHSQLKSSNEVCHARRVCQEVGIKLTEIDSSDTLPFDPSCTKQAFKPNKPYPGLLSLRSQECSTPTDDSLVFISGHGSDHIFSMPPSKKSLFDYVIEKGIKGSRQRLENLASFYRDTFYSILKENVKCLPSYGLGLKTEKRTSSSAFKDKPKWMHQEILKSISSAYFHPIYPNLPSRILPGKYEQVDAVYEGVASVHVDMLNQSNPTFYPFLYAPVVDFALRFPTYDLLHDGYDRYPLRDAVSKHFNTETVWRRDKSETTGLLQLGIKRNLPFVLDLCLKGHLASQGLIDTESLHKTIHLVSTGDIKDMWPLTHLASLELFLRYWDEEVR